MKFSGVCRKGFTIFLWSFGFVCCLLLQSVFGASGDSGGGGVTVTPDGSSIIQIINFLLLIWALNVLLYKPIRKILIQRREKIDGLEHSIENSSKDAMEKDESYTAGLKEARAKGFMEKEALMQQAMDEEKTVIAAINRKAHEELTEVREKIKKEAEVARESLQKEVDSFADQICQKILGRAV